MSVYRPLATACLLLVCLLAPWFFGSVQVQVQVWLWAILGLGLAATVGELATNRSTSSVPATFWVATAAVVLGGWQLLPWPMPLLSKISPATAQLWGHAERPWAPLSLHPAETRYQITLLLGALAAFWIANRSVNTERTRGIFLLALLANGCLLTLVGVAHYLTARGDGVILWYHKLSQGGSPFASFVNRNHAGGYLNLCLASGFGFVIWKGLRDRSTGRGAVDTAHVASVGATAVVFFGVLATLSRSAVLGLAGGVATLLLILAVKRVRGVIAIPLLMIALASAALLSTERGKILVDRFHRVSTHDAQGVGSRVNHWSDALRGVRDFPIIGSGLGTYRAIYRRYQQVFRAGLYYHAENQYLEALIEGGVVGLGLLVACLVVTAIGLGKRLQTHPTPVTLGLAITGAFALVSQALQSCLDFGLYLPSNSILLAALLGLALGVPDGQPDPTTTRGSGRRGRQVAVGLLLLLLLGCGTIGLFRRGRIEHQLQLADQIEANPDLDPLQVERVLGGLRRVAFPSHVDAARAIGRLSVLGYRLAALEDLKQGDRSLEEAWPLTSPMMVYRRLQQSADQPERLAALRGHPTVTVYLRPAAAAFEAAMRACPLAPEVHISLAQLSGLRPAADPKREAALLDAAVDLNPTDPDILFRTGLMDLQAGRVSQGLERWRRALDVSSRYAGEMAQLGFRLANEDQVLASMIPESPAGKVNLARALDPREFASQRRLIAERAAGQLASRRDPEGLYLRAVTAGLLNDRDQQIDWLTQAVEASPRELEWRFELAEALWKQGDLEAARTHARVCAQLAPHRQRFVQLHKRITQTILKTPTN